MSPRRSREGVRRWASLAAPVALATVGLLGAAGILASPGASGSAGRPGFGSRLSAFSATYPPDPTDCPVGPCYGPVVASERPIPEFSFLTLAKGAVVGWQQALRRGVPLLQAELQVAELFPPDVTMGSAVTVIHRDQFGHACAVYDLYSKAIARRYGKNGPAGNGAAIGVELATLRPNGTTGYNPRNIDLAIVVPGYLDKSADC